MLSDMNQSGCISCQTSAIQITTMKSNSKSEIGVRIHWPYSQIKKWGQTLSTIEPSPRFESAMAK